MDRSSEFGNIECTAKSWRCLFLASFRLLLSHLPIGLNRSVELIWRRKCAEYLTKLFRIRVCFGSINLRQNSGHLRHHFVSLEIIAVVSKHLVALIALARPVKAAPSLGNVIAPRCEQIASAAQDCCAHLAAELARPQ